MENNQPQITTNQTAAQIADLPVGQNTAAQIKGGPRKIFVGGLSLTAGDDGLTLGHETEDSKTARDKG
jgi:hypothetical protein